MAEGVLGDIDVESVIFVDDNDSPSGNAGILVAAPGPHAVVVEFTRDSTLGSLGRRAG